MRPTANRHPQVGPVLRRPVTPAAALTSLVTGLTSLAAQLMEWAAPAALTALGTLGGAGCVAVGPDFKAPAVVSPDRWSDQHGGSPVLSPSQAATGAMLPADPWPAFHDAELTRLLVRCQDANQDTSIAVLRLAESRVQETTVVAQHGVQVNGNAAVSRQRESEFGSGARLVGAIPGINQEQLLNFLGTPFTLYQAGFDASWEPDLWGRIARSEEAARATTDEKLATVRQVRLSVAAELARAYFAARSNQSQLLLAQAELAAAQEEEGLLKDQYDGGLIEESALIRKTEQLADLRAMTSVLVNQEARAINQITLLCGAEPGALNAELTGSGARDLADALPDLKLGLPSGLARRRPDIAAAEARLHFATANIGLAVADLYPRITLGASFGFETVGDTKLGDWGGRQWSVGPNLSVPVFDHGRRTSTVTLRKLEQQEAAVAYQQTVLKAWHEVDDALSVYSAESQRRAQLVDKVRRTADEVTLARARYVQGLTTYLPELDARIQMLAAQRDLADGTARVSTALVSVYKALGDGG